MGSLAVMIGDTKEHIVLDQLQKSEKISSMTSRSNFSIKKKSIIKEQPQVHQELLIIPERPEEENKELNNLPAFQKKKQIQKVITSPKVQEKSKALVKENIKNHQQKQNTNLKSKPLINTTKASDEKNKNVKTNNITQNKTKNDSKSINTPIKVALQEKAEKMIQKISETSAINTSRSENRNKVGKTNSQKKQQLLADKKGKEEVSKQKISQNIKLQNEEEPTLENGTLLMETLNQMPKQIMIIEANNTSLASLKPTSPPEKISQIPKTDSKRQLMSPNNVNRISSKNELLKNASQKNNMLSKKSIPPETVFLNFDPNTTERNNTKDIYSSKIEVVPKKAKEEPKTIVNAKYQAEQDKKIKSLKKELSKVYQV